MKAVGKQPLHTMESKSWDGFSLFDQVGDRSDTDHQLPLLHDHSYGADSLVDSVNDRRRRKQQLTFMKFFFRTRTGQLWKSVH